MAAIKNHDGSIEIPIGTTTRGLAGDGSITLQPGDAGYAEAEAAAVPAELHPLRKPRDTQRAAQLEARFATWDHRATA
jgi:hypothetical protein